MNTTNEATAEVTKGTAATIRVGSDTYGATVIEVSPSGKTVTLQYDKCRGKLHVVDPKGETVVATRRQDGKFRVVKKSFIVTFGARVSHWDPSF